MSMIPYFKSKIGSKIKKSVVTNEKFFTEVYERVFVIEVLAVNRGNLTVEVTSYDKVPSGFKEGGTDKQYKELTVKIGDRSKQKIIDDIVIRVDPNFFLRYPKTLKAI